MTVSTEVDEGWSNDRPIKINTFRKLEQALNWMNNRLVTLLHLIF